MSSIIEQDDPLFKSGTRVVSLKYMVEGKVIQVRKDVHNPGDFFYTIKWDKPEIIKQVSFTFDEIIDLQIGAIPNLSNVTVNNLINRMVRYDKKGTGRRNGNRSKNKN